MSDFQQKLLLLLIPIVAGVIFQAGRLSEQVAQQRKQLDDVAGAVRQGFAELAKLIRWEM